MCAAERHSRSAACEATADGLAGVGLDGSAVGVADVGAIDADVAGAGAFDAGAGPHDASATALMTVAMNRPFEMTIGKLPPPILPCTRGDPGSDRARVPLRHVLVEDVDELADEAVATQRAIEAAVDEDGRHRLLEGAGQRDSDVGVLRLPRAVDDAAHDRDAQVLGTRMRLAPDRHLLLHVPLDLLGHL